jgi:F-type H+-transporting ATPase subunit gamma
MPTLKTIRKRIGSVRSTQQITKAMKMVSAAKLRRAQERVEASRPYGEKIASLASRIAVGIGGISHPLLEHRQGNRTHLLLITSDRGLCGGYNANLIRRAEAFIREDKLEGLELTVLGRKGSDYFKRRNVEIVDHIINTAGGIGPDLSVDLATKMVDRFVSRKVDRVIVLYSRFRSTLSQVPTLEQILPVEFESSLAEEDGNQPVEYLVEPSSKDLLASLLPHAVQVRIRRAILEAVASEHGARMTAMDSATSNALEMIDRLTLEMNRTRQANITKELMEIVSGAEALK